jgi:hypothetical protein
MIKEWCCVSESKEKQCEAERILFIPQEDEGGKVRWWLPIHVSDDYLQSFWVRTKKCANYMRCCLLFL